MRTCTKCGEEKPEEDFNFAHKSAGLLRGDCKVAVRPCATSQESPGRAKGPV